jgi:hypothetical protein
MAKTGTASDLPDRRRGRPHKFGRPARSVVLSLPDDVIEWLRSMHRDLAWAIVMLFERGRSATGEAVAPEPPTAELVSVPGRRGLIVVRPERLRKLKGVSLIPLPDGRAFLALEPSMGFADLELAVSDRLEHDDVKPEERAELLTFQLQLRKWRRTQGVRFARRAIVLAEGRSARSRMARPL